MNYLNKMFTYKALNLTATVFLFYVTYVYFIKLNQSCVDTDMITDCLFDKKFAIYQPLYFGGKILTFITGLFLFLPSNYFKYWLYLAVPWLLVTWYLVQSISVYSSGVLYLSRAMAAQDSMYILGFVSFVFIISRYIYLRRKR